MAPGKPARAPIQPCLAVCAKRPFRFLALTVWISRRRSMSWAIGDLYRFGLLNLGSLGRFKILSCAQLLRRPPGSLARIGLMVSE